MRAQGSIFYTSTLAAFFFHLQVSFHVKTRLLDMHEVGSFICFTRFLSGHGTGLCAPFRKLETPPSSEEEEDHSGS